MLSFFLFYPRRMLKWTIVIINKRFICRPFVGVFRPAKSFLHFRLHLLNEGADRVRGRADEGLGGEVKGEGGGRRRGGSREREENNVKRKRRGKRGEFCARAKRPLLWQRKRDTRGGNVEVRGGRGRGLLLCSPPLKSPNRSWRNLFWYFFLKNSVDIRII